MDFDRKWSPEHHNEKKFLYFGWCFVARLKSSYLRVAENFSHMQGHIKELPALLKCANFVAIQRLLELYLRLAGSVTFIRSAL